MFKTARTSLDSWVRHFSHQNYYGRMNLASRRSWQVLCQVLPGLIPICQRTNLEKLIGFWQFFLLSSTLFFLSLFFFYFPSWDLSHYLIILYIKYLLSATYGSPHETPVSSLLLSYAKVSYSKSLNSNLVLLVC